MKSTLEWILMLTARNDVNTRKQDLLGTVRWLADQFVKRVFC